MVLSPSSPLALSAAEEERAHTLYRESIVFICHDHEILGRDVARFLASGVTAKQLHISCDGQIYADHGTFLSSASEEELALERRRVGADAARPPATGGYDKGLFLRSALVAIDYLEQLISDSNERLRLALEPDDIVAAKLAGGGALLLGSEGSRLVYDSPSVLRALYRLGLRHLQLSWAWRTSVGPPQSDSSGAGLTAWGRELVHDLNNLGVIIDTAHLSHAAIIDVVETSRVPVLCSHTGAAVLNPEQTVLLPDNVLQAIANRGGVVAIHFMSQVVKPGRHRASFRELMRQFEHVVALIGSEHVACGPDFALLHPRMWENSGITVPFSYAESIDGVQDMINIARGLVAVGFSDDDVRNILGGSLLRLFSDVRQAADTTAGRRIEPAEIGQYTAGTTPL